MRSAASVNSETEPSEARRSSATRSERAAIKAKKDKNHDRYVVRTYGLEPGQYDAMLAAQGGRCAICRKVPRKRYLAVDHDHRTGAVRGLLCYMCNTALGLFEFEKATAHNAAVYLSKIVDDWVVENPLVTQADKEPPATNDHPGRYGDLPF